MTKLLINPKNLRIVDYGQKTPTDQVTCCLVTQAEQNCPALFWQEKLPEKEECSDEKLIESVIFFFELLIVRCEREKINYH